MAKGTYGVIEGKSRKIKKNYAVIDETTKKIKKMYSVIDGKTRLFFSGNSKLYFNLMYNSSNPYSYKSYIGVYSTEDDFQTATQISDGSQYYWSNDIIFYHYNGVDYLVTTWHANNYGESTYGYQNGIKYSTDYGETWTIVKCNAYNYPYQVKPIQSKLLFSDDTLYLVALSIGTDSNWVYIYKTIDLVTLTEVTSFDIYRDSIYGIDVMTDAIVFLRHSSSNISSGDNDDNIVWNKVILSTGKNVFLASDNTSYYFNSDGGINTGFISPAPLATNKKDCVLTLWMNTDPENPNVSTRETKYLIRYGASLETKVNMPSTLIDVCSTIKNRFNRSVLCYADGVWIMGIQYNTYESEGNTSYVIGNVVFFYSTNCKTWTRVTSIRLGKDGYNLNNAYMTYINGVIYVTVNKYGILCSYDKGLTWEKKAWVPPCSGYITITGEFHGGNYGNE